MTRRCQHIIIGFLFLLAAIFVAQQETCLPNSEFNIPKSIPIDTTLLFQKVVIPNRMAQFIQYLNGFNIRINNNYELLLLLSNHNTRQQLNHHYQIDSSIILMHAELADLMQIEMTELDAQILHFSQRNYQNPFTSLTINLQILAEAEAERILEDVGGWMAGNENPILQNYCLSIKNIESWISQAKAYRFKILAQIL